MLKDTLVVNAILKSKHIHVENIFFIYAIAAF